MERPAAKERSLTGALLAAVVALLLAAPSLASLTTPATTTGASAHTTALAPGQPASYAETRYRASTNLEQPRDRIEATLSRFSCPGYGESSGWEVAGSLDAPKNAARVWTEGRGFRGHQAVDRVVQEIEFATRRANKILDRGKGGGFWGRRYRQWLAAGDPRAPMARGHAIQNIVNEQLANNRYLAEAGVIFDKGSILGIRGQRLLRPDFQMRLPNQAVGTIDITTPGMAAKISKYQDPGGVTRYLLNVLYQL